MKDSCKAAYFGTPLGNHKYIVALRGQTLAIRKTLQKHIKQNGNRKKQNTNRKNTREVFLERQ